MKYVLINDIHLSDRPPASCTETYLDDLFDLLYQTSRIAAGHDAPIILAGDVFHHKAPSRTSHATVMRLIDWARDALVPVYAVPGNHDLSHDRLHSLHESQPLGVVMASGAIHLLDGWDVDDFDLIYGVPWQMTWDKTNVQAALADYRNWALKPRVKEPPALVIAHAPLYPPGRELPYEYFPAQTFAEAMGNIGTVHYGHVHEPHGIYQVDGVTFSNPGALSRGSLHEHNLTRTPAVAIWDSETGEITHQDLDAKPADRVFRLQEAAEVKTTGINLSTFLDSVAQTRLDVTSTASVMEHVRATQEDPALVAVVEKLLESTS